MMRLRGEMRSLCKTLSYRLISDASTFWITLLVTGSLRKAATIIFLQMGTKLVIYFLHERMWDKLDWGK